MLILRILEHDLHRSKQGQKATPLILYTPAQPNFLPAVVSSARPDKFLVVRKMKDNQLGSGVFNYGSENLDELLGPMFDKAYELSKSEGWSNIFSGRGRLKKSIEYIQETSGYKIQPHCCLLPGDWSESKIIKFLGKKYDGKKYDGFCHVNLANVSRPIFLSQPAMVGLYTQFLGGSSSIFLHNVKLGIAFCEV